MPLIPSLRRALARLLGDRQQEESRPPRRPSTRTPVESPRLGQLIPVGDHVVFATSPREAERALVLMMEGAGESLRRACQEALRSVRASVEEVAA